SIIARTYATAACASSSRATLYSPIGSPVMTLPSSSTSVPSAARTFGAQWDYQQRRAHSLAAAERIFAAGHAVVKLPQMVANEG
ncbi:hypothetical protein, partial [Saezia sanguinis]|uniref:hypothetical protein n=1 Tax=Saezia sanguinis TaxID=1965230 RepID=UPI00194F9637